MPLFVAFFNAACCPVDLPTRRKEKLGRFVFIAAAIGDGVQLRLPGCEIDSREEIRVQAILESGKRRVP